MKNFLRMQIETTFSLKVFSNLHCGSHKMYCKIGVTQNGGCGVESLLLVTHGISRHCSSPWAITLGTQLGLHFQPSKIEGPTTCLEFLGIKLDSLTMEAQLPPSKLDFLVKLASDWHSCTHYMLCKL